MKEYMLKEIAAIFSGILLKEANSEYTENIHILQLKDIDANDCFNEAQMNTMMISRLDRKLFLMEGDIVFKAKASSPKAIVVPKMDRRVIPTSQFFIIRRSTEEVTVDYLAWVLNQQSSWKYFMKYSSGSTVRFVDKQVLGNCVVPIPTLPLQERIVKIHKLRLREREIEGQIRDRRDALLGALFKRSIIEQEAL